jgi:small-conductance mechanosensitive channel
MIEILLNSLKGVWQGVIGFLPTFIAALIVFIVGWLIAIFIGKLINKLVKAIKLDSLLEKIGFGKVLSKTKIKLDSAKFFEELVKWFLIIVFLMTAADILGLTQVTLFLQTILYYIPSVIVAAIILLIAGIVAKFMQKLVKASADAAGLHSSSTIGGIVKWAILIFGFVIALTQLGIATTLIQTVVMGIIAMLAIAGGLAFGLGGKDMAERTLEKLKDDLTEK